MPFAEKFEKALRSIRRQPDRLYFVIFLFWGWAKQPFCRQ